MTKKDKEITKAIELTELKRDLANLQQQAQAVMGAMQYITSKISVLEKPIVEETERGNG